MSIPRTTNKFKNGDGTEETYVGCLFDNDTLFITHDQPAADTVPNGYISYYMDQQMDASLLPFYFNLDKAISFDQWLIKGTGKSYIQIMDFLSGILSTAITNQAHDTTWFSTDFTELSSKDQGKFGENNVFQIPFVEVWIGRNTLHMPDPRDRVLDLAWYCGTCRSTWNDQTHLWNCEFGRRRMSTASYGTVGSISFDNFENMMNGMKNFKYCVGPTMGRTLVGASWQWTILNLRDTWLYCYCSGVAAYYNVYNMHHVLGTLNYWDSTDWDDGSGGTVEPTDPDETPDPYIPVPPGPTPPGPVDPTDPVDPVPEPNYPPIDGSAVGIYKIFMPSTQQLQSLAAKLWDPTVWDAIKQMFTNPMEALMGLAIVPVTPSVTSSPENIYLGRYNTQVAAPRVISEYVTVDCGSITIPKFYGSYLDHDPYTQYHLYLPYVGEIDINADEITGKAVSIKYHCNVVTGDCVAFVIIAGRVCYASMGNIIRQLPLSQTDFTSVIQTAVSAASTMLQTVQNATGGVQKAAAGIATGDVSDALSGTYQASTAALNGVANTVSNVTYTKMRYKHAGKLGQGAAQLSVQKPFITVVRPNLSLPEGIDGARSSAQKRYTGYPTNIIDNLSNFHGFTIVEEAQLNMLGATDAEIAEATAILKGGVYL